MPHYETISDQVPHHYENWYHGNISEEQADIAIADGNINKFLVRHSDNKLILSHVTRGWKSHDTIHHSSEGYHLEGKEEVFKTVSEMIQHYKLFPITKDQILGKAVDKTLSGKCYTHKI